VLITNRIQTAADACEDRAFFEAEAGQPISAVIADSLSHCDEHAARTGITGVRSLGSKL
jgi:hypothetical protein